jgi:hypothetical protein
LSSFLNQNSLSARYVPDNWEKGKAIESVDCS